MTSETVFAALPVRRRTTLEILDTALKLYRRYFGVLTGWAIIVALSYLLPLFAQVITPALGIIAQPLYIFTLPLIYGATACCVAAAVRGQKVTFPQVWDFTKPRYWSLVGLTFLSLLLWSAAVFIGIIGSVILLIAVGSVLSALPSGLELGLSLVGTILMLTFWTVLLSLIWIWANIVWFAACLEDDKRGVAAMGRAFELLNGNWKRASSLSALQGIACIAVVGIIGGFLGVFGQLGGVLTPNVSNSDMMSFIMGVSGLWGLFLVFAMPAQAMVSAVLYLDLRVRKEALDIEWTAYASGTPEEAPAPTTQGATQTATTPTTTLPAMNPASAPMRVEDGTPPPSWAFHQPPGVPTPAPQAVQLSPPTVVTDAAPATSVSGFAAGGPPSLAKQSDISAPRLNAPMPPATARADATSSFAPAPSFGASAAPESQPFVDTPPETAIPITATSPAASFESAFESSSFGGSSFGSPPNASSFGPTEPSGNRNPGGLDAPPSP